MPEKAKKTTKSAKPAKAKESKEKVSKSGVFAVISTGGRQYKVSEGDLISIEKIKGDHKEGDKIVFDKVLLLDDGKGTLIGEPYIESAKVSGKIEKIGRGRKIIVIKYKAKSRYFKKRGHRQPFFKVKIDSVK